MPRHKRVQKNGRKKRQSATAEHVLLGRTLQFDAIHELVADLEATQWTARKGYPIQVKLAAILAQYLYRIPTITGLVRALKDNANLRKVCGIGGTRQIPSEDTLYRFRKKVIENPLHYDAMTRVVNTLALLLPDFGQQVAIDGTDIEAWCNTARKQLRDRRRKQS